MKQVGGAIDDVKNKSIGLASNGFKRVQETSKSMVNALAVGIPIIGGILGGIGLKSIQSAAQTETMGIALETAMGGNIELAKEAQKSIIDFATKTPFQLG
jgi:phage tail tape-measure protein